MQINRPLTVDEFHQLGLDGILGEDDRVELIEGELVWMSPIGTRHAGCANRLNRLLVEAAGDRAVVTVQNPFGMSPRSEPQPDLLLAKYRPDFYAEAHPTPEDLLLLVEIMDTSAAYDRGRKLPLYARYGVTLVWLVDLNARAIEVYSSPSLSGYGEVCIAVPGQSVFLPAPVNRGIPVAAILG